MSAKNGKPCRNCGGNEWNKQGACVECHRESGRKWYHAHKEKAQAKSRKWYELNREYAIERSKEWERNHRERGRDNDRRWRKANPAKETAAGQKWYAANKEKKRESGKRWVKANPAAHLARAHRRRTRETNAGGSYTGAEWNALVEHYENKCLCCGRDDVKLTADHVVPVSKGGTSNIDNIQPLCKSCNSRKRDKTIDYRPNTGLGRWIQRKLFG